MVGIFAGGSFGSGGAMLAWKVAGWPGISECAIAVALMACLLLFLHKDHSQNENDDKKISFKSLRR